jgi:hypothetical protein
MSRAVTEVMRIDMVLSFQVLGLGQEGLNLG